MSLLSGKKTDEEIAQLMNFENQGVVYCRHKITSPEKYSSC